MSEIQKILKESLVIISEFPELEDFSRCLMTVLDEANQPKSADSFKLEITNLLETYVHETEQIVRAATEELRAMREAEDKRVDWIAQLKSAATELQRISDSVIARWSSHGALGDTELRAAMLSFSPIPLLGDSWLPPWEDSLFSARWAEVERSLQFIPSSVMYSRDDAQQKMLEILEEANSHAAKSGLTLPHLNIEAFPSPPRHVDESVEFHRVGPWWQFWRYEAYKTRTLNLKNAKAEITRYVREMSRTLLDHLHRWAREVRETWINSVLLEVNELLNLSRVQRQKIRPTENEIARRRAAFQRLEALLCTAAEITLR